MNAGFNYGKQHDKNKSKMDFGGEFTGNFKFVICQYFYTANPIGAGS